MEINARCSLYVYRVWLHQHLAATKDLMRGAYGRVKRQNDKHINLRIRFGDSHSIICQFLRCLTHIGIPMPVNQNSEIMSGFAFKPVSSE